VLDRWVLSRLSTTVKNVADALDHYDVISATGTIEDFLDEVSNWYIRSSRRRFWKGGMEPDKIAAYRTAAYRTLYRVLIDLSKVIAPFVPFISEAIYQRLRTPEDPGSVHLCRYPQTDPARIDADLDLEMSLARGIVSLGHQARHQSQVKVRQPLARILVTRGDAKEAHFSEEVLALVQAELNVEEIILVPSLAPYMEEVSVPNFRTLGPRGSALFEVDGESVTINAEDVSFEAVLPTGLILAEEGNLHLLLDTTLDDALREKGLVREVIHRIQVLRKDAGFEVTDRIALGYHADERCAAVIAKNREMIASEVLALKMEPTLEGEHEFQKELRIDESSITFGLSRIWGDEGKGKITHLLAREADIVVRFNGGPNAGHTVIDHGVKFGTHQIPAGVFYPETKCVLASGMVIDLSILREEVEAIAIHLKGSIELVISENAHLILRAGDLLDRDRLREKLHHRLDLLCHVWPTSEEIASLSADGLTADLLDTAQPFLSSIGDATGAIRVALAGGREVLFEGAQGALLDLDFGTYPYVTSSATTFSGLGNAIGIPNPRVDHRIGVVKAYTTRVGEGAFPTELTGETGVRLQKKGGEFGVTTGRPRRCGWLDLIALQHAAALNDPTSLAVTKLDVLSGLPEIKVCTAYRLRGERITRFPLANENLSLCEPIYERFTGWEEEIGRIRSYDDLPHEARNYLERIAEGLGAPIGLVSVGPAPEETISTGFDRR
jgi:adenylosuccinate synthase